MGIKAMPTAGNIVDAAFLAQLAYDKNPTRARSSWNLLGASKLGMTGAEWDSNTSDAETSPKLFDHGPAQAIIAQDGDTLAIAFRGTDSIAKLFIDLGSGVVSFLPYYSLFSTPIAKVESYALNRLCCTNQLTAELPLFPDRLVPRSLCGAFRAR